MPGIKSFLYLDEYKMYSISSQIFEGMTESWVNIQGTSTEEEERQAGPFVSGRVIAEIWQQESQQQERKYLHDYSYTLFEQHLKTNRSIPSITAENIEEFIPIGRNQFCGGTSHTHIQRHEHHPVDDKKV